MAVAFDAVGPSSAGAGNISSATLSWTHTSVAAGDIIAGAEIDNSSPDSGLSATCTCDSVSMTSLGRVESDAQTAGWVQAWRISGIAAGAHTIQITVTGGPPADIAGGSISFTGGGAFGSVVTSNASGSSTTASVSYPSSNSSCMIAGFIADGNSIVSSGNTSRFINNLQGGAGFAAGNAAGSTAASTGSSVTVSWTTTASTDPWAIIAIEVQPPAAGGGVARPGQTWLRRFHHRQTLPLPPPPAAVAAGPQVFQLQPPRNTRVASRGHLGRMGACAAGILAATTLSPQPPSVPPARPQPVICHPAPHRALWRGILRPPALPFLTAKLPPAAVSPRPPHRAVARGVLAKTTLSAQPSSVPPPQWRQPFAPRPPHRAVWRALAAPPPAVVAVTAVPPARPRPVTNRPPAPHRGFGDGILATTTLSPQPSRVPPPAWRQPNAPRPAHRALWRAIAGPAPAVLAPTPAVPSRPAPVTNRPPAPHRATFRRILAPPAPLVAPERPQPAINRPPPPHRAVVRGVLAKTTLSAQPTRVNGPQWRQPFAPRPAHRAIWRRVAGAAPPPPPFTIGSLTAVDVPRNVLTAAGTSSALTASTAPQSTLTAGDKRTGGPS